LRARQRLADKAAIESAAAGCSHKRSRNELRPSFEANRLSRFLLSDRCPITGASVWGNIFDLKSDDIATAQLAVDGQIEHRQIARLPCTLKPSAY
jgi:hypothetical protein